MNSPQLYYQRKINAMVYSTCDYVYILFSGDEIRGRKRSAKKVKLCDKNLIRWAPYETKAATPAHTGSLR